MKLRLDIMFKFSISILLLALASCKQPEHRTEVLSLRDSILRQHLSLTDSVDFYDTSNLDYKLLKAYFKNDTASLKEINAAMNRFAKTTLSSGLDSCIFPKIISNLKADEAYRFIHSQPFCYFGLSVTISRFGDSVCLQYVDFILPNYDGIPREITFKNGKQYKQEQNCIVIKQTQKILNLNAWKELESAILAADYWGLKHTSPRLLFDPSFWQIDGYTKEARLATGQHFQSVIRDSPSMEAFKNLGRLFIKLAGEKGMCGELQ